MLNKKFLQLFILLSVSQLLLIFHHLFFIIVDDYASLNGVTCVTCVTWRIVCCSFVNLLNAVSFVSVLCVFKKVGCICVYTFVFIIISLTVLPPVLCHFDFLLLRSLCFRMPLPFVCVESQYYSVLL